MPTISPVSSISMAHASRATARVSATIGVEQNNPMFTPGVAKRASSAATDRSAGRDQLASRRRRDPLHLRDHGALENR